jgi:hypothetical protein
MNDLELLFGKEWVERTIRSADSSHPLGLWHKKASDNPVGRYADGLAHFILNSGMVKCDPVRLASKLKAEFEETLCEMDYAVFLGKQGFHVPMEPTAPLAGPDLAAVRDNEYLVEIRRVGLDEARAGADPATYELFNRLCKVPSRFRILISMTDEFGAYSPQLKEAAKTVANTLTDLTDRHVQKATVYYCGPDDKMLIEGEDGEPHFDYADSQKLKAQLDQFERIKNAPFVAQFEDTGANNDRTGIAVHSMGSDPLILQPDKTHLRLRGILHQKRDQLPKASRGIIVLELSELQKTWDRSRNADVCALWRQAVNHSSQNRWSGVRTLLKPPGEWFFHSDITGFRGRRGANKYPRERRDREGSFPDAQSKSSGPHSSGTRMLRHSCCRLAALV